jgi:PKD repeat protein
MIKHILFALLIPVAFVYQHLYSQSYPSLILPKENVVTGSSQIIFTWNVYPSATSYTLELASDSLFSAPQSFSGLSITQHSIAAPVYGRYWWRVKANNSGWSPPRSFRVFRPGVLPGLAAWFSADSGVVVTGSTVDSWSDRSPLASNATQSVNANKPTLNPTAINGKPALSFGGSAYLNFPLSSSASYTYLVVMSPGPAKSAYEAFLGSGANTAGMGIRWSLGAGSDLLYGAGWASTNSSLGLQNANYAPVNRFTQISYTKSATEWNIYANSTFQRTVADNSVITTPGTYNWTIGGETNASVYSLTGFVSDVCVYSSVLSSSDRRVAEQFLMDRYAPPVNLGRDTTANALCVNIPLNAGPNYLSYLWSTGQTSQSINAASVGTYWVQTTDIFGRVSRDTLVIRPPFTFNQLSDGFVCQGGSIAWNPNVPVAGYTLLWSTGATSSTINITTSGNYWVKVSQAGCNFTSDTAHIQIDNFPSASLGNDTSLCVGNTLSLHPTGAAGTVYNWYGAGSGSNATLQVQNSGNYSVTATNPNGCIASDTITITILGVAPTLDFTVNSRCQGDSIQFNSTSSAPLVSYAWQFGDGATSSVDNPQHSYAQGGIFDVVYQALGQNGCANTITKPLRILKKPTIITVAGDTCANDTARFVDLSLPMEGGISSRLWNFGDPGGLTPNSSPDSSTFHVYAGPGAYALSFTVTNDSGCTSVLTRAVTIRPSANVAFTTNGRCIGGTTLFDDQSTYPSPLLPGERLWRFGNGQTSNIKSPQISYTQPGTYTVTLSRKSITNNCWSHAKKTIVIDKDVTASYDSPNSACSNDLFTAANTSIPTNDTIQRVVWRFSSYYVDTTFNYSRILNFDGLYTLRMTVRTVNGCVDSVQKTIQLYQAPTANYSLSSSGGSVPVSVTFTPTPNNNPVGTQYFWDFGGGQTGNQFQPYTISYTIPGLYTTSLRAVSTEGCSDTVGKNVFVVLPGNDVLLQDINCTPMPGGFMTFSCNIKNIGNDVLETATVEAGVNYDYTVKEILNFNIPGGADLNTTFVSALKYSGDAKKCCLRITSYTIKPSVVVDIPQQTSATEICKPLTQEIWFSNAYPSPADEVITIDYNLPLDGDLDITVSDVNGKVVYQTMRSGTVGLSKIRFDSSNWRSGLYTIAFRYRDSRYVVRAIRR